MTPQDRPPLSRFTFLIDTELEVESVDHPGTERWKLVSCKPLPRPPLPELKDADCFELEFECPESRPQGAFRMFTPDGEIELFAVPSSPTSMHVVIN